MAGVMLAHPADLAGHTALVTGATSGVGREIARALAHRGARVIMPVRSRARAAEVVAELRAQVPSADLVLADLDLACLDSVRAFARELDEPVHLCVLNAGIVLLGDRSRHITADGLELHLQTNALGHAVLVRAILPLLRAGDAHVAVQCSIAAAFGRVREDVLRPAGHYRAFRAYRRSKVMLGLFGLELARREPGLHVALCHPGVAPDTAIAPALRAMLPPRLVTWATSRLGNPPVRAALPALAALAADAVPGTFVGPGGFLQLWGEPRRLPLYRSLRDRAAAERVWELVAAFGD